MKKNYQLGSDDEWLKISNDELAHLVKRRDRQIALLRFLIVVLVLLVAWLVYKYAQKAPIPELWTWP